MAYNEKLADRIREALFDIPRVEEKKMFRGVTFMVNGKMCVLTPWPGTSVFLESGERLKVKKAKLQKDAHLGLGELDNVKGGLYLGCAAGCVELITVQPDGKKPMSGADYLNGLKGQGKHLPLKAKIS